MTQPVREQILRAGLNATMGYRNESYGDPYTDMHFANTLRAMYRAKAKNKYSGAHDEAIYRVLMKLARIACGSGYHADNYIDAAAYLAIAAECEIKAKLNYQRDEAKIAKAYEEVIPKHILDKKYNACGEGHSKAGNYWETGSDVAPSENVADMPFAAIEATKKQNQEASLAYMLGDSLMLQGEWHEIRKDEVFSVDVGTIFRASKHEDIIWKAENVTCTFNVKAVPLIGKYDKRYCYFHPNAITHIFKKSGSSNLKCLHCPEDALLEKEVCAKCAMELGQ